MMNADVPRCGVWLFPDGDAPTLVRHAVQAEDLGLEAWWLGDEGPARDPFSVLAAAATATHRIRLAVGIANPYTRHPGITASTAHTVHELSGGRFVLGLGAGGDMALGPFELRPTGPVAAVERSVRIARAVGARRETEGYQPQDFSIGDEAGRPALPVYIGARGERLNRLASTVADGAFVAGIPPLLYTQVLQWVRSVRAINVALYPSVAFTEEDVHRLRPQMIWALMNAPLDTRRALDVDERQLAEASAALRTGDEAPARQVMTDERLFQVLVVGTPDEVGARLAGLVTEHRPDEIGLALGSNDVATSQQRASDAFAVMRTALATRGASEGRRS